MLTHSQHGACTQNATCVCIYSMQKQAHQAKHMTTLADSIGAERGLKACTKLDRGESDEVGWFVEPVDAWLTKRGLMGSGMLLAGSRSDNGFAGKGAKQWASGSGDGM